MSYGEVVLGVECALPDEYRAPRPRSGAARLVKWLIAALKRWP